MFIIFEIFLDVWTMKQYVYIIILKLKNSNNGRVFNAREDYFSCFLCCK